jgi:hypothetical protein
MQTQLDVSWTSLIALYRATRGEELSGPEILAILRAQLQQRKTGS